MYFLSGDLFFLGLRGRVLEEAIVEDGSVRIIEMFTLRKGS